MASTLDGLDEPVQLSGKAGLPIGEVDDEVHDDVGQQLLVDQLIHRATPSQQDLH